MDEHVVDDPARGVAQALADPDRAVGGRAGRPAGAHRRHPAHRGRARRGPPGSGATSSTLRRRSASSPVRAGERRRASLRSSLRTISSTQRRLLRLAHPAGDEDDHRVALAPGAHHPAAAFATTDLDDRGPDHRPRLILGRPGAGSGRPDRARVVHNCRARLWTAGCDPVRLDRDAADMTSRIGPRTSTLPAPAPAAAAPVAPRSGGRPRGCWGSIRGRRSSSTTCRHRWPACSTSSPHRRSGSVWWPGRPARCGPRRGRGAAPAAGRRRGARRRRRAGTAWPAAGGGGGQRASGGGPLAVGCRGRAGRAGIGDRAGRGRRGRCWCRRATSAPVCSTPTGDGPQLEAVIDVVRRVAPGHERRAAPGPRRAGPVRPRRRRRTRSHAGRRRCTATASRTCPSGCATASESSGRSCFRVARRAWGASSCTGAAATPAGRPSRPSSSDAAAEATRPRRWPPRRWAPPRCCVRWTSPAMAGRPCPRCSAPPWSSTSARGNCCTARGRPTRTARVAHPRRTDVRAALRTGDNHEVMSAARPLK